MRINVATVCARVGIAALAALGVFAMPAGAASAAVGQKTAVVYTISAAALTPAQCDALRLESESLDVRIISLQDRLAEAPAYQKAALIKQILKLEAQQAAIDAQIAAGCPA